jgi:hypothetical protein
MNSHLICRSWAGVLPILFAGVLGSCGACGPTNSVAEMPGRPLTRIFVGGTFVGAFPTNSGRYIPAHGITGQALPDRFVAGQLYVFHFPATGLDRETPLVALQRRLATEGFTVTVSEPSADVSEGIRIFEIRFKRGECSGNILRVGCEALTPEAAISGRFSCKRNWEPIDTILSAKDNCRF